VHQLDEQESPEAEEKRLAEWLKVNRAVFAIVGDRKLFAGLYRIQDDYDPLVDQMVMKGLPDWDYGLVDSAEIHSMVPNNRPDRHDPTSLLHAFKQVLVIRPLEPLSELDDSDGNLMIKIDPKPRHTYLRLSGRFEPY
jgi:hypothetical protein